MRRLRSDKFETRFPLLSLGQAVSTQTTAMAMARNSQNPLSCFPVKFI